MNDSIQGKKLLILAGELHLVSLVERARELGVYTIVTDYYDTIHSPAKLAADDEIPWDRSFDMLARLRMGEERGYVQGTERFAQPTSSDRALMRAAVAVWERTVPEDADVRGIMMTAGTEPDSLGTQLDLLGNAAEAERDNVLQRTQLEIKRRFGKNSVLKAMDLAEGATTRERNHQIGGHRSGE